MIFKLSNPRDFVMSRHDFADCLSELDKLPILFSRAFIHSIIKKSMSCVFFVLCRCNIVKIVQNLASGTLKTFEQF